MPKDQTGKADKTLKAGKPKKNKPSKGKKPGAQPLKRTAKSAEQAKKAAARREAQHLREAETAAAQQLAQIVNLTISGHSFAAIGEKIGKSGDEVEAMLVQKAGAYIRTQPALRAFARNWIGEKYTGLLDAVYTEATTAGHEQKLEHQDRAIKILKEMARLYGADAPTQSEVRVESTPEAVEKLVARLSQAQGVGYNTDIFDAEFEEVVDEAKEQTALALDSASHEVERPQEGDGDGI